MDSELPIRKRKQVVKDAATVKKLCIDNISNMKGAGLIDCSSYSTNVLSNTNSTVRFRI